MAEEKKGTKIEEEKLQKPKQKPKPVKKKHKALVVINFKVKGESYRKGDSFSTEDKHLYNKLLKRNFIKKI